MTVLLQVFTENLMWCFCRVTVVVRRIAIVATCLTGCFRVLHCDPDAKNVIFGPTCRRRM